MVLYVIDSDGCLVEIFQKDFCPPIGIVGHRKTAEKKN